MAIGALPLALRSWLRFHQRRFRLQRPRVGTLKSAHLWRVRPVSRVFGLDRGLPIDRYYIERFLSTYCDDLQGHVLEVGDDYYTRKFSGGRLVTSDVLHVTQGNPKATIVADLTCANSIPSDTFDCIICTQTLQMIYDVRAALGHLYRILRPCGVLLVTCHGISKIARREGVDPWGEYWRLTAQSARRLLEEFFPAFNVTVATYGNVLAAVASLHGLAVEEMAQDELDYLDPDYEVLIGIRAKKGATVETIC
jgi:SAM-dependent methyltransferase